MCFCEGQLLKPTDISFIETVVVLPHCSEELKPFVGQCFKFVDFATAFYDVYAPAVGFDIYTKDLVCLGILNFVSNYNLLL